MSQKSSIHFDISEHKVLLRIFDVVSVLSLLYLVGLVFNFDYFKINSDYWFWSIILAIYLNLFATIFELYDLQKASKFEIVVQNIILTSSVTVLFYFLTPFLTPELPQNRLQIVFFYISINFSLFIWRYAYIVLISTPRFYKRVLLICNAVDIDNLIISLQKFDPNYKVIGYINTNSNQYILSEFSYLKKFRKSQIEELVKSENISEIVIATAPSVGITASLNNRLISLLEKGVPIREYTQVYEEITHRVPVQHVERDFYKYFPFSRSNNKLYIFFHRILDMLLSLIGLAIGLLISPFILIGNLIANKGPFFYTQMRVGHNGKQFKIFKLRSMIINAEKDGAAYATEKDPRVTKFGRFLRKSRLDEIPQFINVIKGDMSVIGPRPERPVFVQELSEKIPFYEIRHIVKPGVTGWAQVNSKYGSTKGDALEKLQYDLYYIKHRSLFLDISIVFKTLSTIIFFRGQ